MEIIMETIEKHPQLFPMLGQMKNVFSEFNLDFENDNWHPGSCDLVNATTKEWAFNSTRVTTTMDDSTNLADFIYMRSGNKDFGIGVTTNKTFNIYNQGNDCFKYWWENVCDDCNTDDYGKLKDQLGNSKIIKTNKEGLKFSEMKANGNFNTYYYHTNDASNSFDYSQTTGANFKIKTALSPSLNDYIAVVATHRKNQSWLAVSPYSDAELPHDLLDTTNLTEVRSLQADIAVNVQEIAQKIEIFPNPFNDNIIIQNNSKEDLVVEFTTIDGKTIKQTTLHERENKINTATLNSGLYLVKITRNGELILTSKLLKL
jgi:hemin uptake protein HemP